MMLWRRQHVITDLSEVCSPPAFTGLHEQTFWHIDNVARTDEQLEDALRRPHYEHIFSHTWRRADLHFGRTYFQSNNSN